MLHRTLWAGIGIFLIVFSATQGRWIVGSLQATWSDHLVARTVAAEWQALADAPAILGTGDQDDMPTIVMFMNYECFYCRLSHEVLAEALDARRFKVVVRHLPFSESQPAAVDGARLEICAGEQGRATASHRSLVESTSWHMRDSAEVFGAAIELPDIDAFTACLASDLPTARLAADSAWAARLGIIGTPAFVSRRQIVRGALSRAALESLLSDR
jgi:protein-disulfide isomerase